MDGRSTYILALALVATGLAGCIQNPAWLHSTDLEVTAGQHRALADAAAASWSENAVLVGIMAVETSERVDPRLAPDNAVGNGLAPAWWYVYCAEDAQADTTQASGDASGGETTVSKTSMTRAFKVVADGTVTSEDDAAEMAAGFDHDMAEALGEWTLDSDAALAVAKSDETFRDASEGANATVLEGIARHDGRTAWWFAAASASGLVVATVDALTGELVEVKPIEMDFVMPAFDMAARDPMEWAAEPIVIEGEGTLGAGEAPAEFPFETTSGMWGSFLLEYRMEMPTDGLHYAILDEDGELVAVDHIGGWRGDDVYEMEIEIEEPGSYTLVLEYMTSAPVPPTGLPLGGAVDYAFVLELMPGEMPEHAEDEDEP